MITRLKHIFCLSVFLFMVAGMNTATAQEITVMTRNLYLGADLTPLVTAHTEEELFQAVQAAIAQVAASNFPERAWALATEIAEKKPHLVGLQEVYNFTLDGLNGPTPFRNHLDDFMASLAAQGVNYTVAAVVENVNLAIPLGGNVLGIVDRDVILARSDVAASAVPLALSGCRESMDGCNYQIIAVADTPFGEVGLERGFVAVDALVGDTLVRFVETHLEERQPDPANPLSPLVQAAQAFELISILTGFPNPYSAPVIVVGDINSDQYDQIVTIGPYTVVPPYTQFANAGYIDAWLLRPGNPPGLTCCQDPDLLNPDSILYERVDVTFLSELPVGMVKVNVTGNDEEDKTFSGLWPSDHAGIVTRLEFDW